jgi:two-component system chemotaxis sensor kinase CheA
MENVLDLVRNGQLKMNEAIFDLLFKSLDSLESMVENIAQGGDGKADVSEIVAGLQAIVSGDFSNGGPAKADKEHGAGNTQDREIDPSLLSVILQSIESGYNAFEIDVSIEETCAMKAVRAYMVFQNLGQLGEIVSSAPPAEDIEQDKFGTSFTVHLISSCEAEEAEQAVASVSEIESVKVTRLDAESLNKLETAGASAVRSAARETAAGAADAAAALSGAASAETKPASRPQGSAGSAAASRTIRVDIEKLDVLMNLFSELLIDRVRLEQLAHEVGRSDLVETVEHMSRVSSDLQNIVLNLRMVPIETVFNRFPRMVRDLAKSLDKKIEFIITGAETELDRTVIDEIGDPLVHLLRNAVDHGIETVPERIAAGKPETGTLYLRAFHSGNHVIVEIEEDGRGINAEKVLNTAIKRGLVTQEQAASLKEEEIYMLLFKAGFSTADQISDISGRGVGLDVVKSKIESLGGSVYVQSKLGQGSKFTVQLPLTLSIISAMLVKMGGEKYAIPLSSIVETAVIRKQDVHVVHGSKMIKFREHIVPILSLSRLFDVPGYTEEGEEETETLVIRKGDKLAALMVDDFIGQQEIVLKPLGNYLTNLFAISGATILGDGQVALIIDPNALIK